MAPQVGLGSITLRFVFCENAVHFVESRTMGTAEEEMGMEMTCPEAKRKFTLAP